VVTAYHKLWHIMISEMARTCPPMELARSAMPTSFVSPITSPTSPQLLPMAPRREQEIPRASASPERLFRAQRKVECQAPRILIRPQPGFYVMRLRSGAPLVALVIYQLCPMVIPQPLTVGGPHPDDWCRPLDRSRRYEARLDGKRVDLDRVWTARSLRPVSHAEFEFRSGPLRRWARENPNAPEARPYRPVDLAAIPPLF
jgi:hypothetical protein